MNFVETDIIDQRRGGPVKKLFFIGCLCVQSLSFATLAKQSYKIYTRINSVPPKKVEIDQMVSMLGQGNKRGAIEYAIDSKHFYNIRLKNWVKSWTNEDQTNRVPFNDYTATVIGFVRDGIPFKRILSSDIIYTGRDGLEGVPAYSIENNDHYDELEKRNVDLKANLVSRTQSSLTGIMDTAGVMTTRAAAAAFFVDGTNRAMTRYTFMNFLCKDFEELHDTNIPDFRVRRDVDRAPGGDSRAFKNKCVGCHAGQDALGGAFAYFDFTDGKITYSGGSVVEKINRNNLFSPGHIVRDDGWMNLWANGQNSSLGWRGPTTGNGARSLGQLLGDSKQFSACMVKRSYKMICLNEFETKHEEADLTSISSKFENEFQYNMKDLFAEVATLCL